ncbi:hypothetical protein [Candidatus Thiosymbion oneisti]|uniref:hypothetical protein n=1 Tax=Candidatus Thiosymbion oneisti TaxID=589554 RepID=UPI0013FD3BDB|nr:hypothetical protein [Candidatus Thiosymbion oneisti]
MTPDAVILVPTRCVGSWLLCAAESIRPVSTIRIHGNQTWRLSGVIRCGPEGVCSERCRQLVMGSVSRLKDGGPSRLGTADILSAPGIADILSAPGTTDISLVLLAIG